ncbi:hypothetical protein BLNAU_13035 [Blattamonas nauphoetae]|uniref:Right handed beta helix domain-containing protein n=1 Tax=Blattamonas nauphoetae TaxID=2049346 RepID=A0ABQ9XL37_9EUKA|nr:hypothetical protein BLNAU_13035 [Blattamonas nauphoetae]
MGSKISLCTNHFDGGVIRDMNAGGNVMICNTTFSLCTTRSRPSPNIDHTYTDQTFTSALDRIAFELDQVEEGDSVAVSGCSFTDVVYVLDKESYISCGGAVYLNGPFSSILINDSSFERCFIDATDAVSGTVTGMVVYIRLTYEDGSVTISECSFSDYVGPDNSDAGGCVSFTSTKPEESFVFSKNSLDPKEDLKNVFVTTSGLEVDVDTEDAVINNNTFQQCNYYAIHASFGNTVLIDSLHIYESRPDSEYNHNSINIEGHALTVHSVNLCTPSGMTLDVTNNGSLDIDNLNITNSQNSVRINGGNVTIHGLVVNRGKYAYLFTLAFQVIIRDVDSLLINSSSFSHIEGQLEFHANDIVLDDVLIDNNTFKEAPVKIYSNTIKIYNSIVSNNYCTKKNSPGALYFPQETDFFISNTHFSNNSNSNDPFEVQTGSDIAFNSSIVDLTSSHFVKCSSTSKKHRIYNLNESKPHPKQVFLLPTNISKGGFDVTDIEYTVGYGGFVIMLAGGLSLVMLFFFIFVICICECSVKFMQS